MEHTLNNANIEQIKIRYENAKKFAKQYKEEGKEMDFQFEIVRAYALEGILRDFGLFYDEVIKEQGICR